MTWSQWKTLVKNAYHTTAPNAAATHRAVASFVKGQIAREVDRDVQLSRSYRNDYAAARVALAGYTVPDSAATVKAAVLILITVDGSRPAIANYIDKLVTLAIDELNAGVTLFNALLLETAVHLQQQVECLQAGHETTYKASDLSEIGAISEGSLPSGCSPKTMSLLRCADDLAEDTAYSAGDLVQSNLNIYEVVTGGTIGLGELGDGLTSTDSNETQTIDGVEFRFSSAVVDVVLDVVDWGRRRALMQADPSDCGAYVWGINHASSSFFVHPQVDDEHELCLEWDGIKLSFADDDVVPFDEQCARAAAENIRAHLSAKFEENNPQTALADARYKEAVRRIAADCLARRAGV